MPKFLHILCFVILIVVILAPICGMIIQSFISPDNTLTIEYYKSILLDSRQQKLLMNSVIIALGTTAFSVFLGVPIGFFIARTDLAFKQIFSWLYLIPLLIPSYIHTVAWIFILPAKVNVYSIPGCVFILTTAYFPFITLLTISGLNAINREMEDAARNFKGEGEILQKITFPMIVPYVLSGASFVFIFSIMNYGVPSLLRVNTYPVEIFTQFSAFYNEKSATALSIILVLITMGILAFQAHLMKNKSYLSHEGKLNQHHVLSLKKFRILVTVITSLIIFTSAILPVITLIVKTQKWKAFTIALKTSLNEILSSLGIAAFAATCVLLFSFFAAYLIERSRSKSKNVFEFLTYVPFAIPATVLGIGLIKFYNNTYLEGIYKSFLIVAIAMIARFSPFAIRIIASSFKQIDRNIEEPAVLHNVSWIKRIKDIILPLSKNGLLAGWIVVFILCMQELGSTLLVIPAGTSTLPLKIYTLMHYGTGNITSALCLILLLVTIIPISIVFWLNKHLSTKLSHYPQG